jgi:dihydroflavonol-4-reductase
VPPLCFVTGATGFVGRHLVPQLAAGHRLRLLLRPGQATPQFAALAYERVAGHLGELTALQAGCAGADLVVHLAALVSFRSEDRAAMFAVNTEATAALAAIARTAGVRRFLHASTISAVAYRDRPEAVDENAPYNFGPLQLAYHDSKFAAERAVLAECQRGLDAVIVNLPSMYGAGDRRKGEGSLLQAVHDGKLKLNPPGGISVADVTDVCTGILAAIARGRRGERYLLGGENLTGAQLVQRIATIVGGRAPRRTAPQRLVLATARALRLKERWLGSRAPLTSDLLQIAGRFLWCRSDKAARELGWHSKPVDAGIAAAWRELQGRQSP